MPNHSSFSFAFSMADNMGEWVTTKYMGAAYRAFNIGTLKIRLNAKHPIINLPIVTGLGTTNESIAADLIASSCLRVAARSVQYPRRINAKRLAAIAKPAPAGISADIKSGPAKDRWRRWRVGRCLARQISRHRHLRKRDCEDGDN